MVIFRIFSQKSTSWFTVNLFLGEVEAARDYNQVFSSLALHKYSRPDSSLISNKSLFDILQSRNISAAQVPELI